MPSLAFCYDMETTWKRHGNVRAQTVSFRIGLGIPFLFPEVFPATPSVHEKPFLRAFEPPFGHGNGVLCTIGKPRPDWCGTRLADVC